METPPFFLLPDRPTIARANCPVYYYCYPANVAGTQQRTRDVPRDRMNSTICLDWRSGKLDLTLDWLILTTVSTEFRPGFTLLDAVYLCSSI